MTSPPCPSGYNTKRQTTSSCVTHCDRHDVISSKNVARHRENEVRNKTFTRKDHNKIYNITYFETYRKCLQVEKLPNVWTLEF